MVKSINTDDGKIDVDAIIMDLNAAESPKQRKERVRAEAFALLYERIRDKIKAGMSKRQLIELLANRNLMLSTKQFDELLEKEAKRRGEPVPGKDDEAGEDEPVSVNTPQNAPQAGAKEEVIA